MWPVHTRFIRIGTFVLSVLAWSVSEGNDTIVAGKSAYESKQYSQAIELLSIPAHQGQSEAQFWLGLSYEAQNDYPHAKLWLRKAAAQGSDQAQVSLGLIAYEADTLYAPPMESYKFYQEAEYWFTQAANKGNGEAMLYLGTLFTTLVSITDNVIAGMWYGLAAQHLPEGPDKKDSQSGLTKIKNSVSAQEWQKIQERISNWNKAHPLPK